MKKLLRLIVSPLWFAINLIYAIITCFHITYHFIRYGGKMEANYESEADKVREEMCEKLSSVILENYRLQEELKKYQKV